MKRKAITKDKIAKKVPKVLKLQEVLFLSPEISSWADIYFNRLGQILSRLSFGTQYCASYRWV